MLRAAKYLAVLFAVALLAAAIAGWQALQFLKSPLNIPDDGVVFEVRAGSALASVSQELADLGVIDRPAWFRWYGRLSGKAASIRAGEYVLDSGLTPETLLDKLVVGNVRLYSLTIVEGWTFRELLAALRAHPAIDTSLVYEDWPAILETYDSEYDFPEGLFLPETYRFPKNTSATEVLRQAYEHMQDVLQAEWSDRDPELPLNSPYEALVLASIIEKETALAAERPRIAGVFVRRLQQKMRLQTDPTVIYGVGENFDGNLTRRHLRTDTPYNTYTRHGLPPTPIALPGRAAIHAALHPAEGTEVFFVATGLSDGSHQFSDTREEHEAAVEAYLKRLRSPESRN